VAVSVVIRKVGGAAQWTCTVLTPKDGGKRKEKCGHMAVADTEQSARVAYEAHKKEMHR
jgi:hypothetical protein